MSFDHFIFANAIRNTLSEPAVRMVNFTVRNRVVGTMFLEMVAGMIMSGKILCAIDPSKMSAGAVAAYYSKNKTIYGSREEGFYADDKSTFVHECTHAMFHIMGFAQPTTIRNIDNEIAAYLAGAIYIVASGQTPNFRRKNDPIAEAFTIASTKKIAAPQANTAPTNAGSPIEFLEEELTPLIQAIQTSPYYKDWNSVAVLTW